MARIEGSPGELTRGFEPTSFVGDIRDDLYQQSTYGFNDLMNEVLQVAVTFALVRCWHKAAGLKRRSKCCLPTPKT
jgi:hypothetical protein